MRNFHTRYKNQHLSNAMCIYLPPMQISIKTVQPMCYIPYALKVNDYKMSLISNYTVSMKWTLPFLTVPWHHLSRFFQNQMFIIFKNIYIYITYADNKSNQKSQETTEMHYLKSQHSSLEFFAGQCFQFSWKNTYELFLSVPANGWVTNVWCPHTEPWRSQRCDLKVFVPS